MDAYNNYRGRTPHKRNPPLNAEGHDDVPTQVVPQNELFPPRALISSQHEHLVACVIAKIALWGYSEILVDVCPPPSVVVRYVGVELLASPRDGEKVGRVEECSDMGE